MPVGARIIPAGVLLAAVLCAQSPLRNGGFADGKPGEAPAGWQVEGAGADATVRTVTGQCHAGTPCLAIESKSTSGGRVYVHQQFDAAPFRDRSFVFKATVRAQVSGPASAARLVVEIGRQDYTIALRDGMVNRPITSPEWGNYQISGTVAPDARSIQVGLELTGAGSAWFDEVSFSAAEGEPLEPPRPLTPQGLENLAALARMFGVVRYFHPSDEAAAADWSRFAITAVRAVEGATSPTELAAKLQSVFAPIAPRVQVLPAGAPRPMMEMQSGSYVTLWQHRGLGPPQGRPGSYFSMRFLVPATQTPLVAFAPYRADLPGAVSCLVPLALYRGANAVSQPPPMPPPPGSPSDRATRLAAVIVAWNVFQNFYPYFDDLGPVWLGALGPLLSKAAIDPDAQAFHATLQKMLVMLRDGRAEIRGPGAAPDYVPPVAWGMVEGKIVALSAAGADVQPGDALISIDGKPAGEVLEAIENSTPGSTPQAIRERALRLLLARAPREKVRLEVEPAAQSGTHRTVTLECLEHAGELYPKRPEKIAEIETGILYVDLDRVTDTDLAAALSPLVRARGLVLDLRGPHMTAQLFPVLGRLMNRGAQGPPQAAPIVTRPDGVETMYQENPWYASPMPPYFAAKKAFLIGGGTAGTAEMLLAFAAQFRLGEIVGETSAGAAGTLNSFTVPGGYELTWTGERVRQYDGSPLFGVGIRPTIAVAPTRAAIAAGRDEVLDRALQAVK